ncbi:MAG TPA: DMT family transporter [Symbiobacteriaceae bacterium]|nr:DMT family transporter [Symbiobacteriaceae bacterium]
MGAIFALVTGFCWAAYNLAVRRGLENMDSGTGYVITLVFGSLANIGLLFLPLPGRGAAMVSAVAVLWFAMSGLVNTIVGRWALFRNIQLVGPSRASAWKNATPLYTLVFGFLLLGERPDGFGIAGTACVIAGLFLLSREQLRANQDSQVKPVALREVAILGIVSGMCFSAAMLFRKAGLNHWPDAALGNTIAGLAALVVYMPYAWKQGETKKITRAPWKGVSAMLLAGAFSALAQLTTFLSLRVTMAATTQVITALEPLFTMVLSAVILKRSEVLNRSLVGSAAMVCLGVILMTL